RKFQSGVLDGFAKFRGRFFVKPRGFDFFVANRSNFAERTVKILCELVFYRVELQPHGQTERRRGKWNSFCEKRCRNNSACSCPQTVSPGKKAHASPRQNCDSKIIRRTLYTGRGRRKDFFAGWEASRHGRLLFAENGTFGIFVCEFAKRQGDGVGRCAQPGGAE